MYIGLSYSGEFPFLDSQEYRNETQLKKTRRTLVRATIILLLGVFLLIVLFSTIFIIMSALGGVW